MLAILLTACAAGAGERPNIVWLTNEDHGPHHACYGDAVSNTPTMEALARRGQLYARCWSNAPVCAPARTTLISGLFPTATGSEHMRSMLPYPAGRRMLPQLLRDAGYYCSNNAKEDYNLAAPGPVWEASSNRAHYRGRAAGQPFFAVFNSNKSHESQVRKRPHRAILDPARVRVPAYQPDLPEIRRDWAQYHDQVAAADADAGARLQELADAGLADSTIVFYFADHGPGLPRCKRWPGNSGLHVPLAVFVPERWRGLAAHYRVGEISDRIVSFVDFAPTVLSLAGLAPPAWLHGTAFLGPHAGPAPEFAFGFRGRMDEAQDFVRSATDGRYVYLRNYRPDLAAGQFLAYAFATPSTRAWKRAFDAHALPAEQAAFFQPKPAEELYDLFGDPDETRNVAAVPAHAGALARYRAALAAQLARTRDVGFLPEGELHRRQPGRNPLDWSGADAAYPFANIAAACARASAAPADVPGCAAGLADAEPAVRYWSAYGLAFAGADAVRKHADALRARCADATPEVAAAAAYALAWRGDEAARGAGLAELARRANAPGDYFGALAALQALQQLGPLARPVAAAVAAAPNQPPPHPRYAEFLPRLRQTLAEAP